MSARRPAAEPEGASSRGRDERRLRGEHPTQRGGLRGCARTTTPGMTIKNARQRPRSVMVLIWYLYGPRGAPSDAHRVLIAAAR